MALGVVSFFLKKIYFEIILAPSRAFLYFNQSKKIGIVKGF
jgi:hypothetical protein